MARRRCREATDQVAAPRVARAPTSRGSHRQKSVLETSMEIRSQDSASANVRNGLGAGLAVITHRPV